MKRAREARNMLGYLGDIERVRRRKPGEGCGLCDCYTAAGRCNWGFRLKRKPDDWCDMFGSRAFANKLRELSRIGANMDTKKIIFEYCEKANICVLRQNNYSSGLDQFVDMFGVAKQDFPGLEHKDITIKIYGGDSKGQSGLEFKPPSKVPEKYERMRRLEKVLN